MAIAVAGVGTSGPLIAATAAPALAIAFWRNAIGTVAISPAVLVRHVGELRRLNGPQWLATLCAGVALGLHFATWTPSLTMTSVASATAFVAAQPIFAAFIAVTQGEHISRRVWAGIVIAVAGVVALSGVDLRLSVRAFSGDLLALLAGALAAIYMTFGSRARQKVSLAPYAVVCYGTAALVLGGLALATGESLVGLSGNAWLKILALTAAAQMLGHTLFNHVLKTTSATMVSLCILLEVPTAALIAALWLGQVPSWSMVPGALLILAGLAVVVSSGGARDAAPRSSRAGVFETAEVTEQ
jgi:drug/metabolite transporter (DMT)-like permease